MDLVYPLPPRGDKGKKVTGGFLEREKLDPKSKKPFFKKIQ